MGATNPKPNRRKTEKAIRDRAGVPVLLCYDEENDKTIMIRATEDGNMYSVIGILNSDGDTLQLSGETQNNQNSMFTNTDNTEGELETLLQELRIMNIHLTSMTGMNITKDDLGDDY